MRQAIVLHSDILGFKDLIFASEADKNEETLKMLQRALFEGIDTLKQFMKGMANVSVAISYKLFSDNLYVSFSYDRENISAFSDALIFCFVFCRAYTAIMLDNKVLIRGGISFGSDYSDDNIIFSVALVKAYLLESKTAIYPRVVIDNELIKILQNEGIETPGPIVRKVMNNSIVKDSEGIYFINPVGLAEDFNIKVENLTPTQVHRGFIKRYFQLIIEKAKELNENNSEEKKIIVKYNWFKAILIWNILGKKNHPAAEYKFLPITFPDSEKKMVVNKIE